MLSDLPLQGKPINTVADLTNQLRPPARAHRSLFRGQNTDQPLFPKIARVAMKNGIHLSKVIDIEKRMLERFRRESVPMLPNASDLSDWELLSIARHSGLATRLMDWTANALVGLWFAVWSNIPEGEDHAVLWMLNVKPKTKSRPNGLTTYSTWIERMCFSRITWIAASSLNQRGSQCIDMLNSTTLSYRWKGTRD